MVVVFAITIFLNFRIMKNIVIAIDGHSSCGKSTFAKLIAKKYNYIFIDTGAMYRAVTLFAIRNGLIVDGVVSKEGLISALPKIDIYFKKAEPVNLVMLCGEDVSSEIRTLEVSSSVSLVSSIFEVRQKMVSLQQEMGKERGVVMDGRDIGTVVFPDAELKIFMTATVEVRAKRRYKELIEKGDDVSYESIAENIAQRDFLDETREESPLRRADDALLLDNSDMTLDEQMAWVEERMLEYL